MSDHERHARAETDGAGTWRVPVIVTVTAPTAERARHYVRAAMSAALELGVAVSGYEIADEHATRQAQIPHSDATSEWTFYPMIGWFRLDHGVLYAARDSGNHAPDETDMHRLDMEDFEGQARANLRIIRRELLDRARGFENAPSLLPVPDEESTAVVVPADES